jgi:pyruvate,water dikinase
MEGNGWVVAFEAIGLSSVTEVGAKHALLGEVARALAPVDGRVPEGFATRSGAFYAHLAQAGADEIVYAGLSTVTVRDIAGLTAAAAAARARVNSLPLPADLRVELLAAYAALSDALGAETVSVSVGASGTVSGREGPFRSQETFLNVRGERALLEAVRACMASAFSDQAVVYRAERGISVEDAGISVGVRRLVRADLAGGGLVAARAGGGGEVPVVVRAVWGLSGAIAAASVEPDEIVVVTVGPRAGTVIARVCGAKATKLVFGSNGHADRGSLGITTHVDAPDRAAFVLDDAEASTLARWSAAADAHISARFGRPLALELEWAKDGPGGPLYVVGARERG